VLRLRVRLLLRRPRRRLLDPRRVPHLLLEQARPAAPSSREPCSAWRRPRWEGTARRPVQRPQLPRQRSPLPRNSRPRPLWRSGLPRPRLPPRPHHPPVSTRLAARWSLIPPAWGSARTALNPLPVDTVRPQPRLRSRATAPRPAKATAGLRPVMRPVSRLPAVAIPRLVSPAATALRPSSPRAATALRLLRVRPAATAPRPASPAGTARPLPRASAARSLATVLRLPAACPRALRPSWRRPGVARSARRATP